MTFTFGLYSFSAAVVGADATIMTSSAAVSANVPVEYARDM